MEPNFNAEVSEKAATLVGAIFAGLTTEESIDKQFIAIMDRIELRVMKLLRLNGGDLTSIRKSEQIDTLVSDMKQAASRLRWLVQGPGAPGPVGQRKVLGHIEYLEFVIRFGRLLRGGAEKNGQLLGAEEGMGRIIFIQMQEIKAGLAAMLVIPGTGVSRPCPVKFLRAWEEYNNLMQILAIRFTGEDRGAMIKM